MPYPNEHACRLANPNDVKVVGSITREHEGKPYRILVGKRAGKTGSEAQAYRYPKDEWTAAAARAHCEKAGGSFEAAAASQQMNYLDPINNPLIGTMFDPELEAFDKEEKKP
jgi:hypothetical protein